MPEQSPQYKPQDTDLSESEDQAPGRSRVVGQPRHQTIAQGAPINLPQHIGGNGIGSDHHEHKSNAAESPMSIDT